MLWFVRAAWATLPVTVGSLLTDALDSWSTAPRVVAAVLLWAVWAAVLLGLLVPRPISVAAARTTAPIAFALAIIGVPSTSTANAVAGVAGTLLAWTLVSLPDLGEAGINALAYGDERRFLLKVPPALFLGPLPLAAALFGAGIAAGPLLLADGRVALGVPSVLLGFPVALGLWRSFLGLTRRMAVLVPAGIVIVDPTSLGDPYLFPDERIARLRSLEPRERPEADTLDTRAGAFLGARALELNEPASVLRVRPGRRGGVTTRVTQVWFAPVRPRAFAAAAAARRPHRGRVT